MRKTIYSQRQRRVRALLIERRKSAGLTQARLAKLLSKPQSYVSNYERGQRRLDLVELLEIADAIPFAIVLFIDEVLKTSRRRRGRKEVTAGGDI